MAGLEEQVALLGHRAIDLFQVLALVLGCDVPHAHRKKLVAGIAEPTTRGIVDLDHSPVASQDEDGLGDGLEQGAVAPLVARHGPLGGSAIGDIADVHHDSVDAFLAQPVGGQPLLPAILPVLVQVAPLGPHPLPRSVEQ